MKRIGLFLLAVVMVAGLAGCPNSGDDFSPTVSNMAGVYTPTKVTYTEGGITVTLVPPDISGTLNLTAVGTYTVDLTMGGTRETFSGTYAISGDTIIFDGDGSEHGTITDDGRKISITGVDEGQAIFIEFIRS